MFTDPNPTFEEINFRVSAHVRYAVWQLEVLQGKRRLQGYIEFSKPMSSKTVKRLLGGSGVLLHEREGSRNEARENCLTSALSIRGPWEYGIWISGTGASTDMQQLQELYDAGMSELQISVEHVDLWGRNWQAIQRYFELRRTVITAIPPPPVIAPIPPPPVGVVEVDEDEEPAPPSTTTDSPPPPAVAEEPAPPTTKPPSRKRSKQNN